MAAQRRVVSVAERSQFESTVNSYIADGFSVQNRTPDMAVLFKKKEFSMLWAIVGLVLCVLPLLVYLIIYSSESDQYIEVRFVGESASGSVAAAVPQLASARGRIGAQGAGLYERPDIGYQPRNYLAPGTLVEPLETRGAFTRVSEGWIRSNLLEIGQFHAPPVPPSTEKVCPRCAETVKAAAKVCRYCGYNFDDADVPSPRRTEPS